MKIRQLRYFVQTAEFGSISRAALSMRVAQSAVSRQISNLEDSLGAVLLVRHGRGVILSDFGKRFLVHARVILDEVDQARRSARNTSSTPSGRVTVAVPPIVAPILIPHLMLEIRKRLERVQVRVQEGLSATIADWVAHGTIDIGVHYTNREPHHGHTDLLLREPLGLIAPTSAKTLTTDAIDFGQLSEFDLILPPPDHHLRMSLEKAAARKHVQFNIVAELETVQAIMEMVRLGEGLTIMPLAAVALGKPDCPLKAVPIVSPRIDHLLVSRIGTGAEKNSAVRAVGQIVRQQVTRLVKGQRWSSKR